MTIHQERTHPQPVDGCFACRIGTIQIAASALPTRAPGIAEQNVKERVLTKDMAAYKSMRGQGLQPSALHGADKLSAEASSADQVTTGLTKVKPAAFGRFADAFGHGAADPVVA